MKSLNTARKHDLINLCEKCWNQLSEKNSILVLIKFIKISEDYEEDFKMDRLEILMSGRNEKEYKEKEQEKLQAIPEDKKLQTILDDRKLHGELEEKKLQLQAKIK